MRGETAAESLNDTYDDAGPALRGAAIVNEAFLGDGGARPLDGCSPACRRSPPRSGSNEAVLQDWVVNFNRTMAIFADEKENVSADDPPACRRRRATPNRAFASLNRAFPPTRAFAREILPGVRETAATIEASFPWIRQTRQLLRAERAAGPGRASSAPAARDLAARDRRGDPRCSRSRTSLAQVPGPGDPADGRHQDPRDRQPRAVRHRRRELQGVLVHDGRRSPARARTSTATARCVRFQTGGGTQTLSTGRSNATGATRFFNAGLAAARHAAGVPRQAPAVPPRRSLLQAAAPGPQRARTPARPTARARRPARRPTATRAPARARRCRR